MAIDITNQLLESIFPHKRCSDSCDDDTKGKNKSEVKLIREAKHWLTIPKKLSLLLFKTLLLLKKRRSYTDKV